MRPLRLGTRGSQLALWQARTVMAAIAASGGPTCELITITTSGDRLADAPLAQIGGKRLFVKEIEEALLEGRIDLAVHSAKDMPAVLLEGLSIGAILVREEPQDALVAPEGRCEPGSFETVVAALGPTPRIATSSVRRIAQLSRIVPSARFQAIRGNLDTRLRKLDRGDADVLILAAAGINRLGFSRRITARVPLEISVPAAGQGAVAVEVRADDRETADIVARINHQQTHAAVTAERAFVAGLGGGCQTPIGAVAVSTDAELDLRGLVTSLDGTASVDGWERGSEAEAAQLGERLSRQLLSRGADTILEAVRRAQGEADTAAT